ncbi:MAG: hypothetical protein P1U47_03260 [Zhongshania sp.]|uniref:hypothetical protein n=1 Tax=Zhongshania sp. TaxID=1971902 RepID=UPI00260BD024|nr:hypothetical protein [Zhongshania sp.]MDF1691366.1 hypothetical protein [Zhongshania sp.]
MDAIWVSIVAAADNILPILDDFFAQRTLLGSVLRVDFKYMPKKLTTRYLGSIASCLGEQIELAILPRFFLCTVLCFVCIVFFAAMAIGYIAHNDYNVM